MTWFGYALAALLGFGVWGAMSKLAMRELDWSQTSLFYAILSSVLIGGYVLTSGRKSTWSPHGVWVAAVAGLVGAIALVVLYFALSRGKASVVMPVAGAYPVVTVALSVLFLNEKVTLLQIGGIGFAIVGVVLIGVGG